jgi:transglutaminase-like putative cysteine protease
MQYVIQHVTRFTYAAPISESTMEARMQPLTERGQRCLRFELSTNPRARMFAYQDPLGNIVHHFDILKRHTRLQLTAEAIVDVPQRDPLPVALDANAWEAIDDLAAKGDEYESLAFSKFVPDTDALRRLSRELRLDRTHDPLTAVRRLNSSVFEALDYVPRSTRVDSTIDEVLKRRAGVCQDFAHVMIGLVRLAGIPCRYVSGYLSPNPQRDRSAEGATHAWVEAWLPSLGWIGFDPANNATAAERHVRVAVGRDYADVPPTRGVFKGPAASELAVSVTVSLPETPISLTAPAPMLTWSTSDSDADALFDQQAQAQQQQ